MTLQEFLDLGTSTKTLMVHGVDRGGMLDMMKDGALESLTRQHRGWDPVDGDRYYLVGKIDVDGVDVTLFSEDFKVASESVAA